MLRFELCLAALLLGCSGPSLEVLELLPTSSPPAERYLRAVGDQLVLEGEPLRFLSFNAFTLTGCGNGDERFDPSDLDDFFASLRPRSLVRTYAFRAQRLADIDAVIDAAERHHQLLNLVLTDANGSCGDGGAHKDERWFASDFRDEYLPWVEQLVAHCQARPNVGAWELVSSPTEVRVETLRAFYDEVGGVVHRLAPHQLVSSGTHGAWAYGGGEGYARINASPGVDIAGCRDYEQEPGAPPNLQAALTALAGSKPLILAEAGIFASPSGDAGQLLEGRVCVSWATRRDVLQTWVDAAFQTRLAGMNVWNYLPRATSDAACSYSTLRSDPLFDLVHDAQLP